MTIVLICPKCSGNAWLMLAVDNIVCYDCGIPMVDSAAQQPLALDGGESVASDDLPFGGWQPNDADIFPTYPRRQ